MNTIAAVTDLKTPLSDLWNQLKRTLIPTTDPQPEHSPREGAGARVLIIDASPSMLEQDWPPSRLAAAQEAAAAYVDRLVREEPDASVAIITYCASSRVVRDLTPASDVGRLKRAISRISVNDWTNSRYIKATTRTLEEWRRQTKDTGELVGPPFFQDYEGGKVLYPEICVKRFAMARAAGRSLREATQIAWQPLSDLCSELGWSLPDYQPRGQPDRHRSHRI